MSLKSAAADCDHNWEYSGGVCRCTKCGNYLQPSGDITTTPTGRAGKVISHTESVTVSCQSGDDRLELPGFLPIWNRVITEKYDQYLAQSQTLGKDGVQINQKDVDRLMTILSNIITGHAITSHDTACAISSLITSSGLLANWTTGFSSFALRFDLECEQHALEASFVIPKNAFSGDFVERFIAGKDSIGSMLRRSPVIEIALDPCVIDRCSTAAEIFETIHSAITYYSEGLDAVSAQFSAAICQLGEVIKKLIISTPLISLVIYPIMTLLHLNDIGVGKDAFKLSDRMIRAVVEFPSMILKAHQSKNTEGQAKIIEMLQPQKLIKSFPRNRGTDAVRIIAGLPRALKVLFDSDVEMQTKVDDISRKWVSDQVDSTVMTEAAGRGKVKRLKKIPSDLVSYIVIEGEAIRDPNDKMLIVSYAYGKLDIVDWYIELIDVQSKRYIVPHTRDYLVNLKRDLLSAIRKIMDTPIAKPGDPVISIKYPKGYEG